ncbi:MULTISPECIES: MarR family transcriptional regulator [unclassified Bacillus (in: firmicutes)]|uniref:MarR family winged helix-turn-helix transcriptional regulator n=1 Tax=unclassified Bacillus (in: firmicutes) TaxID=185979 RepID=UPI0008DFEBBA|nr:MULTISPECIES: MarR family transcriptional regulator [unclassified Bacillus (in: firmicutes)]PGZ86494.1 MarR family transcriptional regulator [Bacillus sp. AFS029533]SFC33715.1 MarR family transcriptional regulator, 2-MHQ and catechol-resistance regulon repressor [Bacillus sp. UNCCL81]
MNQNEISTNSLQLYSEICKANRFLTDASINNIKCFGLNLTEFAVLELLYHKGDQPIQQIGKRILISSGNMTYVLDKLEARRYIKRIHCPKDRRVIYAALTEEGRSVISCIFPAHSEMIHNLFSQLNSVEKDMLIYLLKKIGLSNNQPQC